MGGGGGVPLRSRCFGTVPGTDATEATTTTTTTIYESDAATEASLSNIVSSSTNDVVAATPVPFEPSWYNPTDQTVRLLEWIDSCHDLPYGATIVGTTVLIRLVLTPVTVVVQRNASRMAHMKPELDALKARVDKLEGSSMTAAQQQKAQEDMRALFRRYDCNPLRSAAGFAQIPVFVSLFFATQRLSQHFPEKLVDGGALWFPDLTASDPYYALPVLSSLTFLATIELNKQHTAATTTTDFNMNNVFRVLAVGAIPLTAYFPTAVLCYFATNNTVTMAQTALLQTPAFRTRFGIWDPPPPKTKAAAAADDESLTDKMRNLVSPKPSAEETLKRYNENVEMAKMEREARGADGASSSSFGGRRRRGKKRRRR